MTGPEHYREAEKQLANAERHNTEHPGDMRIAEISAACAQVHATLSAGSTATADVNAYRAEVVAYRRAVVTHIAWGLSYAKSDEEHESFRSLATALEESGIVLDLDIEQAVKDIGWVGTENAWKPPTVRRAEWDSANPCPF